MRARERRERAIGEALEVIRVDLDGFDLLGSFPIGFSQCAIDGWRRRGGWIVAASNVTP